jgi:hypothetical protein
MEISQLRSGWNDERRKLFVPQGTMDGERRIPLSLQDTNSFCNPPDTMCLANFQLSLWDETIPAPGESGGERAAVQTLCAVY